jgi:hypothetical protein
MLPNNLTYLAFNSEYDPSNMPPIDKNALPASLTQYSIGGKIIVLDPYQKN